MQVKVGLLGILGHYAGCQHFELDLAEGATVGEVVQEIARRFGSRFPEEVWETDNQHFTSGVNAFVNMQDVEDYDAPLADGSEVLFLTMIAGG